MKKEPIDYGDEYAPKLHFSAEQIEELQDAGCDDELIKALAYNVGRICEERVYLGLEPTPALTIRRSLDKIEKHARSLLVELQEGPPEVRRKLANTLYFDKLEIDEIDEIDGKADGYHPLEVLKQALHAISSSAYDDERRQGKGSAGRRRKDIDGLTLDWLSTVEHEGGHPRFDDPRRPG